MRFRSRTVAILIVLSLGLLISLGFNLYPLIQSPTVIGIVDSKSIGQGTDERGETKTWYTASLALVVEDKTNNLPVGGTLAYIIAKEDFDRIHDGAVVKGRVFERIYLDVLDITIAETFATGDDSFFRHKDDPRFFSQRPPE